MLRLRPAVRQAGGKTGKRARIAAAPARMVPSQKRLIAKSECENTHEKGAGRMGTGSCISKCKAITLGTPAKRQTQIPDSEIAEMTVAQRADKFRDAVMD